MNKDGVFVANDISISNIEKLSEKQSVDSERRICEIAEIAAEAADYYAEMAREGYGVYEILSIISDGYISAPLAQHGNALEDNRPAIKEYLKRFCMQDKVIFAELFLKKLQEASFVLGENDFLHDEPGDNTVVYVKNSLADEAYDVFSQDLSDPRVRYSATLGDAVKLVSSGEAEYALLPLEERGGARLAAVAELIFKEDLKINSVTPVFGFEGLADMKYALVSKHFTVPAILPDDDRYLEIRIKADAGVSVSELFSAAETLDAFLYRINTLTFATEDGEVQYFSVVFRDDGKDFSPLLVYLTLFSGAYTPIGIYKNLE